MPEPARNQPTTDSDEILNREIGALSRLALRRTGSARVARARCRIKRRLRRLGYAVDPLLSTRELIELARPTACALHGRGA